MFISSQVQRSPQGPVGASPGGSGDWKERHAATKIQATFRGRQTRKKIRSGESIGASPQGSTTAGGSPQAGGSSSQRTGEEATRTDSKKEESDGFRASNGVSGSRVKAAPSFCAIFSASQVKALRSSLGEQKSRLPDPIQRARIELWMLLEEPRSCWLAQAISISVLACTLISIVTLILETMPELKSAHQVFIIVEVVCTSAFTTEYCMRLITCTIGGISVCEFVRSPMNIVDLSAIMPFYLSHLLSGMGIVKALGLMRIVRLVRLFRIFKLGRYSSGLQLMMIALKNSTQGAVVLCVFLAIGIIGFSSLVYYVEKMSCPDREALTGALANDGSGRMQLDHYIQECHSRHRRSQYGLCCNEHDSPMDFPTIIETFWWCIVTMTTVGFGDVVPQTLMGKCVGSVTMLCGILLLAMPIAIIGRKFQEAYDEREISLGRVKKDDMRQEQPWPSLREMGQRMTVMRLPDHPEVGRLARELAEEFEEAAQMQEEIVSMRKHEMEQQGKVMQLFDGLLTRFLTLSDSEDMKKSKSMVKKGAKGGLSPPTKSSKQGVWRSSEVGPVRPVQALGRSKTWAQQDVGGTNEAPPPHSVPETTLGFLGLTRSQAAQAAELQMSPTASSPSRPGSFPQVTSLPGAVFEDNGFTGVLPSEPKSPVVCTSCGVNVAKMAAMTAPMSLTATEAVHGAAEPASCGHALSSPRPPPASQATEQDASSSDWADFDGDWGNASNSATIHGKSLTFGNGDQAQLAFPSARKVLMFYDGGKFQGEVENDGKLHWCDGDVWTRSYPSGGLDSKNFGSPLSPMAQQSQLQQQWLPPAPPG